MVKRLSGIQAGVAGEYFVAAELSRRGYVASITLRQTRGIDILASNRDATRSAGIQVKTAQSRRPAWVLNKKAETDLAENLCYVFVCLPPDGMPDFYVVPRRVVGKYVRDTYKEWIKTPGRSGQARNETDMRQFRDPKGEYRDRWDLLRLDSP